MRTPSKPHGRPGTAGSIVWVASMALAAAAGLHLIALGRHLDASPVVAAFFLAVAVAQVSGAYRLACGPSRRIATVTGVGTVALLVVWAISRTVGVPLTGEGVEAVAPLDAATVVLELAIVALLVPLVRARAVARRTAAWGRLSIGAAVVSITLLASAGGAVGFATEDHHGDPHRTADAADGHSHP